MKIQLKLLVKSEKGKFLLLDKSFLKIKNSKKINIVIIPMTTPKGKLRVTKNKVNTVRKIIK